MRISDWSSDVCSSDLIAKDPPWRAAMGRGHREALTEGQGRYRRGPSTTCFASGPPPHGFATGRIERNSRSPRDFLAFEQRRDDLFDTPALDLGGGRQDDAVAQHPRGKALDIVGNHIIDRKSVV